MTELYDPWDRGFIMVPKNLYAEYGIIGANIYARIADYCSMEKGYCYASQDRIAKELGVSRATVNRHIKALCLGEYIEDKGPDPQHPDGPNRYVVITWNRHEELKQDSL